MTPPRRSDRGGGLIGAASGLLVALVLLSFALQLLLNLYATSALTAVAHDTASRVASSGTDLGDDSARVAVVASAEAFGRALLGRAEARTTFAWSIDPDHVRLTVTTDHPSLAVGPVARVFGTNRVERTVVVRVETPR